MGYSKKQIESTCWDWTSQTDPSDVTTEHLFIAYRLTLPPCPLGSCRRNCRGSPHCLNALGEKQCLGELKERTWTGLVDPVDERREDGAQVGLQNLGATCYVNSLLQLWYHTPEFRDTLFLWEPERDPAEDAVSLIASTSNGHRSASETKSVEPKSLVGKLVLIFAQLHSSKRKSLDPSPLIEFLDLERDVQQDVHEFCRLFTSLLEEQLQKQKIPSVRNLIRNLYRGEAVSVTRCSACGYESANKSAFYELTLHIKGHKELTSSILDYLKTEELVDGNQYSCPICGQKRDATIQTQVPTLPPILNLQLMRFEFNMASLTRKKLSTKVHFPEFLDASILQLNSSKGVATESRGNWYELFAVLLHKGTSASSGHYVAHIRDLTRQLWFEFNDEVVGEVDRKNLKTVFEKHDAEDSSSLEGIGRGSGGASKGKEGSSTSGSASTQSLPVAVENGDAKGTSSKTARSKNKASFTSGATFTSSNAYLLVYRKQTMNEQPGAEETIATPLDAGTAPNHSVASVKEEDDGGDQVSTSVPPSISPPPSIASSSSSSTVAGKRKKALENPESGVPVTSKRRKAEVNSCRSPCVSPPMEDHVVLPTWAQNAVDEDNANFESWCQETLAAKNNRLDTGRAQQSEIQNLYNSLPCENWRTEGFDLIATSWITNWLANGGKALKSGVNPDVPPIDNGKLQCEHGKADPLRMGQVKCVNPIAAEALYTLYGGGPRFTQDSLCLDCVRDVCQEKRIQMELEGVQKHLSSALKKKIGNPSDVPDSYWIGCASLRAWKRLALRQRLPGKKEKEEEEKEEEDEDCGPDASNVGADSAAAGNSNAGSTGAGGSSVTKFNEDIVCDHGNLCVAPQRRKLITKEAWDILRNQFSSCPEFPGDSPICESCANSEEETKERLAQWREMAKEQKEALPELFRNRDERDVRLMGETVHFVNQEFLSSWRRFIKNSRREPPPQTLGNAMVLCPHDKLPRDPAEDDNDEEWCTPVTEDEWTTLQKFYTVDLDLQVENLQIEESKSIRLFTPEICETCSREHQEEAERKVYTYRNQRIFVRKVTEPPAGGASSSSETTGEANGVGDKDEDKDDADSDGEISAKRPSESSSTATPMAESVSTFSKRARLQRGEKGVMVSSDMTVKDLKKKLLQYFSVIPSDQELAYGERTLSNDTATLAEEKILPGARLTLKVAEYVENQKDVSSNNVERGFFGTKLMGAGTIGNCIPTD